MYIECRHTQVSFKTFDLLAWGSQVGFKGLLALSGEQCDQKQAVTRDMNHENPDWLLGIIIYI